jgi:hypothetical protein
MISPGSIIKLLLKITIVGLLIGSVVVAVVLFYCVRERERTWENANKLASEFKVGATEVNFLDRAKQLGADSLDAGVGEWNVGDTTARFDQLSTRYKSVLEGHAHAVFKAGPFERDICYVTFKKGKVIEVEVRHLE